MRQVGLLFILISISLVFSCTNNLPDQATEIKEHQVNSLTDELEYLYRIELLPQYRDNTVVEQVSSYDTTGGNNDGFSGLYSFIRKEGKERIIAELEGPGVIERIWTPTPSEDTIEFYFDGEDQPRIRMRFIDLFTSNTFPFIDPLAGNEIGGYYCYVPIPYQESCKIVYIGDQLYFHQIQYRKLADNSSINSFPISWDASEKKALRKAAALWTQQEVNLTTYIDSMYTNTKTESLSISINPGESKDIVNLADGGRIISFELEPSDVFEGLTKDLILEIRWDNDSLPAVFCPVADFFGYAYGEQSMQSLLIGSKNNRNYCYIPMPFDESASIRLIYKKRENTEQAPVQIWSSIRFSPLERNREMEGKLYTIWRREIQPEEGEPFVFQNSYGKGHHVGTIMQAQGLRPGMTGFFEGDDSTRVDGELSIHGTGSEDYFNGGWYALANRWDKAFSLPIHGCLDYSIPFSRTGGYRFYLTDKIPYTEHFYHTIEHGPVGNKYPVDYTSVAFYYSDSAPNEIMVPENELLDIYIPDTLVVLPNLMKVTVGINQSFDFSEWYKGVLSGSESERPTVIYLDEIPEGRYDAFISFISHPEGCDVSLWQRQKRITGILNTKSDQTLRVNDHYIGEININQQYNSLSIKKLSADPNESFILTEIRLVRM